MSSVRVLDLPIDCLVRSDLLGEIDQGIQNRTGDVISYVNVHVANLARKDKRVREFLLASKVRYCDGEGVRLASRILGKALPERIALTHWIWDLAKWCNDESRSIYLLGGTKAASEEAERKLRSKHPELVVAGRHHGYFDWSIENQSIVDAINKSKPDILFVGMGMPRQVYWVVENMKKLDVGVIIPCGMMIEYVAGTRRSAPRWMTHVGLEWFHRFVQEPKRLWSRYLVGNPLFLWGVLLQLVREGRQR